MLSYTIIWLFKEVNWWCVSLLLFLKGAINKITLEEIFTEKSVKSVVQSLSFPLKSKINNLYLTRCLNWGLGTPYQTETVTFSSWVSLGTSAKPSEKLPTRENHLCSCADTWDAVFWHVQIFHHNDFTHNTTNIISDTIILLQVSDGIKPKNMKEFCLFLQRRLF